MKAIIRINEQYLKGSDIEIKNLLKTKYAKLNGGYVTLICRKCGCYYHEPNASTDNAKVVNKCRNCFDV